MFIRQMSYLVALAREKHFARAAEACHVSQPTLSAAIQHLEKELGVSIVERGQRFEGFTAEGERVLAWAQRLLADWDGLRQAVRGMRASPSGELRCGVIPTQLPVLSLLTGPFREHYPDVMPVILSMPSSEIIRGLQNFELDFGVTYLDLSDRQQMSELPLCRERYVLLLREDAARGNPASMSWAEAARLPLCALTKNMTNRSIVDAAFLEHGAPPHIAMETDSILALYSHVCFGGMASVVPRSLLMLAPPNVTPIDLDPPLYKQVGLLHLRRDPSPPLVELFSAFARDFGVESRIDELIRRTY